MAESNYAKLVCGQLGPYARNDHDASQIPLFPDNVYPRLPRLLREVTSAGETRSEKDALLIGGLTTMACCLSFITGKYRGKTIVPNLFSFIYAPASTGKGVLGDLVKLVMPVHNHMRIGAGAKKDQGTRKSLLLPANNTAPGLLKLLAANDGRGLIFESEADTLTNSWKGDFGDYSDILRKAFHGEPITSYRKTEDEYLDVAKPLFSLLISGTPHQVKRLIPSSENGLFSRFIFYRMSPGSLWSDVFSNQNGETVEARFEKIGHQFFEQMGHLDGEEDVTFSFTENQQAAFNESFQLLAKRYVGLYGEGFLASIRRLGLIHFKIAMILTALRTLESSERPHASMCMDSDFHAALDITAVLIDHAAMVYRELPHSDGKGLRTVQVKFFEALPEAFSHQKFKQTAHRLGVSDKTAERYIAEFVKRGLLTKVKHGEYEKGGCQPKPSDPQNPHN